MSSNNKPAISQAFSSRLASLQSLIDDLVNSHFEERAFISANLIQYATDAGDMARRISQEKCQNQFYGPLVGDAAASPAEALGAWQDWIVDLPNSPPLPDLPSEEPLDLTSGNCTDREHDTDLWELINIFPCSNDRLRAEQTLGRSVTIPRDCEDSHIAATDQLRSRTSAVVDVASIEEFGQPGCANIASSSKEYSFSQSTVVTRVLRSGKPLKRTSDTRPQESTDSACIPPSKKRRVTSSASRTGNSRKQIYASTKNLDDLYLASAGSEALCQLNGMIDAICGIKGSPLAVQPSTVVETLRMLDALESFQHATVFLRRTCFLKLWKLRESFAARFTSEREQRPDEEQPRVPIAGKPESNILDDLLIEGYPGMSPRPHTGPEIRKWRNKYEKERKSLKNRMQITKSGTL